MKKNAFIGLLAIVLVFGFIGCDNGDEENDPKVYTVTIGTLTKANGSTITANPINGVEGTEITLTITENNTYRLKPGTLKYGTSNINESTFKFNLPAENVIITAQFFSLLIGDWDEDGFYIRMGGGSPASRIISFFEDGTFAVKQIFGIEYVEYRLKGTWVPQDNVIVILTTTHVDVLGNSLSTLEELDDNYKVNEPVSYNWEILTNNTIKPIGSEYGYTRIQ